MMHSLADHLPKLFQHIERHVTLSPHEKQLAASVFTIKRVLKRQYLLQEGDICRHESFVTKGCLRIFYVDKKGTEHTLHFAVENWWISDLESFIRQTPSQYHIEALETTIVLQIDRESLHLLYQKAPVFERYFHILHQNASIALSKRILYNISLTAEERYKIFMDTYADWYQRIPQKYIASYLGITPVFLSQIRGSFLKKKQLD